MIAKSALGATIFEYGRNGFNGSNRDLWAEIAADISSNYADTYSFDVQNPMSLKILNSVTYCPKRRSIARYRVIRANVLRASGHTVFLELALGNCFTDAGKDYLPTAEVGHANTLIAQWIRSVSRIPHSDHVARVREFILDSQERGWLFPLVEIDEVQTGELTFRNVLGKYSYRPKLSKTLARDPLVSAVGRQLVLVSEKGTEASIPKICHDRLRKLQGSINSIRGGGEQILLQTNHTLPPVRSVSLIVIPDSIDLSANKSWIEYLQLLERNKNLFKLVKNSTLSNHYAMDNVIYDLSLIAGSVPWIGEYKRISNIVAVDAGHDVENEQTLWVLSDFNLSDNKSSMDFHTGSLHEDMPRVFLEKLGDLTNKESKTFFRDGRFHKGEIRKIENEGIPSDKIFSVTKRPEAVLFRGTIEVPQLPSFGDCALYPDGCSALLQSIEPSPSDYDRPILLRGSSGIDGELVTDVMTLCKLPTLTLFHPARLPSPIYWADIASKRSIEGWAKAIGRGWGVPPLKSKV